MHVVDILIVLILIVAAIDGWRKGLVRELFSFVGIFLGLYLANLFYQQVGYLIAPQLLDTPLTDSSNAPFSIVSVLAFVLIWVGVPVGLWVLGHILTRFLKLVRLGTLNSLLGVFVSMAKGLILLGILANVVSITKILSQEQYAGSRLFEPVRNTTSLAFDFAKQQWEKQQTTPSFVK